MPLHPDIGDGVRAFVFDAYGTIFDVHSAVMRHAAVIGPQAQPMSDLWRAKQLEYSWVLTLAGRWRNFWELTEDALDVALARFDIPLFLKPELMAAYRTLSAYPETRGVLDRLRAEGFRTGVLSNGETTMLHQAVASAGVGDALDHLWSVDVVEVFKPNPQVYRLATDGFGLSPREICLVSSNRWDVAGAVAFGMQAVWVNRAGHPPEYPDLAPRAVVKDLNGLL
ncbi:MAG: haloacid dehalogenase, type II [Rhizobiales bacterium 65-9]|nr:haloacid dehalogenase type II [Hyphomicrobiales bacterium]OJY38002.1 MAG: haloacid dehalogenase, type II [Rhizobiales bacterium 65-9]